MRNSVSLSFLLFIFFMVAGYSVSTLFNHSDHDVFSNERSFAIAKSSDSIQAMNNGQRNILLIGVDTLEANEARLTSLWLVTYLPTEPTLNIFPISPAGDKDTTSFEAKLNRSFNLYLRNDILVPSQSFVKTLERNNYWWSGYIIFDTVALSKLQYFLANEENKSNQSLMGVFTGINDPQNSYSTQLAIFKSACQKYAELSHNPDWSSFNSLIPNHVLTDMDLQPLILEWDTLLSSRHNPNCRFPILQLSQLGN